MKSPRDAKDYLTRGGLGVILRRHRMNGGGNEVKQARSNAMGS